MQFRTLCFSVVPTLQPRRPAHSIRRCQFIPSNIGPAATLPIAAPPVIVSPVITNVYQRFSRRIFNTPNQTPATPRALAQDHAAADDENGGNDGDVAEKEPRRIRRTGMNSAMVVSPKLRQLTRRDLMTRPEVVKEVVRYIRVKNLFVEGDRRKFICDAYLSDLLGVDGENSLLRIQKWIGQHLQKPSLVGPTFVERADKMFAEYVKQKGAVDSRKTKSRDPRGYNSAEAQKHLKEARLGMYADVIIDPVMRPICDGRDKMSRPEAIKAVWKYIKENELQDKNKRRTIVFNDTLRTCLELPDIQTLDCFHIGKHVMRLCHTIPKANTTDV